MTCVSQRKRHINAHVKGFSRLLHTGIQKPLPGLRYSHPGAASLGRTLQLTLHVRPFFLSLILLLTNPIVIYIIHLIRRFTTSFLHINRVFREPAQGSRIHVARSNLSYDPPRGRGVVKHPSPLRPHVDAPLEALFRAWH